MKVRPNLVPASMEDIRYTKHDEERRLKSLNSRTFTNVKDICDSVKADVDAFVGDAPQFDDMTMLAFLYKAGNV